MPLSSLRLTRWVPLALLFFGVAEEARAATAEEKVACADAYTEGQRLRRAGELLRARERLLYCARDLCTVLKADCAHWVDELDGAIPTVVLRAHDSQGHDLSDARVLLDGRPLVDHLDGRSIPVDTGTHVFRFERQGMPSVERQVVLGEADKARSVIVEMGAPAPPAGAAPVARQTTWARPVPWPTYALAGLGAAGLVSFAYFGLTGRAEHFDLERCSPGCSPSSVDATRTKLLIADVSLGVSLVALGAATYLLLTRPRVAASDTVTVDVRASSHGGALGIGASF
jgi:hypothetical protein